MGNATDRELLGNLHKKSCSFDWLARLHAIRQVLGANARN